MAQEKQTPKPKEPIKEGEKKSESSSATMTQEKAGSREQEEMSEDEM